MSGAVQVVTRATLENYASRDVDVKMAPSVDQPTENVFAWQGIMGIAAKVGVRLCIMGSTVLKLVQRAFTVRYPAATPSPASAYVCLVTMVIIVKTPAQRGNMVWRAHLTANANMALTVIT